MKLEPHVVSFQAACVDCGAHAEVTYVAAVALPALRVSGSLRCARCACAQEWDGDALLDEAREAFIRAEGRWGAFVGELGANRMGALRVLRTLHDGPPGAAAAMLDPRTALLEGARVEVERIQAVFAAAGVPVIECRLLEPPSDGAPVSRP